jgi:glycosyltransferase involved in cell wall biosynthesis
MIMNIFPKNSRPHSATIIITAFNQACSLDLLLASLEVQVFKHSFDVIVCDDGSGNDVRETIERCAARSTLDIRHIWQRREGYRAARSKNNAIRCAQGDYLVFLDADIVVGADFLQRHIAAHQGARQIVCNPRRWIAPTTPVGLGRDINTGAGATAELDSLYRAGGVECLLRFLATVAQDVGDRAQQRLYHASSTPWMACMGFSLSVDRAPEVWFDEAFEGWGPEDRELGFRLMSRHGHTLVYKDDLEVFHLECCSTGRTPFEFLPTGHAQIVAMLRNLLHFSRLYPDRDLGVVFEIILHYKLDPLTDLWVLSPVPHLSGNVGERITLHFCLIERWLRDRQSL